MSNTSTLAHHGILGQKWGIRRFQNPDGSLTPSGKLRQQKLQQELEGGKVSREQLQSELKDSGKKNWNATLDKAINDINNSQASVNYNLAFTTAASMDGTIQWIDPVTGMPHYGVGDWGLVAIRQKELEEYGSKYIDDHMDDFASAALKDLGYDDTKAGREYLKSIGLKDWEV